MEGTSGDHPVQPFSSKATYCWLPSTMSTWPFIVFSSKITGWRKDITKKLLWPMVSGNYNPMTSAMFVANTCLCITVIFKIKTEYCLKQLWMCWEVLLKQSTTHPILGGLAICHPRCGQHMPADVHWESWIEVFMTSQQAFTINKSPELALVDKHSGLA